MTRRFRAAALLASLGALPGSAASAQPPGASEHAEARRLLDAGEGAAAVESAFAALLRSEGFSPPEWSREVPEGNIVLDEFTGAANAAYRSQRAAYRVTLGDALAATGDAEGAAREYHRAVALDGRPGTWRRLADLPGTPLAERVGFLLRSWAGSGGQDLEILDHLRESGAFRTENGLAAAVDRFRFSAPETSRRRPPEGTTPYEGVFPRLSLAVEGGVWSSERSFSEGRSLVLYFPSDGCPRCGEVLDELHSALRGQEMDVIAAVSDADLAIMNRIAQLTGAGLFMPEPQSASARSGIRGRPIGHVVRRDVVEFRPDSEPGESLWLAARAGLSVWSLPLEAGASVRRDLNALSRFLDDSPVTGSSEPLAPIPDDPEALIAALRRLEAGAEPLGDLEERLLAGVRAALREARDPEIRATALLQGAADLRIGDAARLALLSRLLPRFGDRQLAAAQALDPSVTRAVPGGRVRVAVVEDGRFAVQRDYEARDGSSLVFAALIRPGDPGDVRAITISSGRALAVSTREPGFLLFREPPDGGTCVSWSSPEGPLREDCAAEVHEGAVTVPRSQLVAESDAGRPGYRLRIDGGPEPPEVQALTEGLQAFSLGDLDGADAAFTRAADAMGPGSPLDRAAVRYNRAMVEEARGDREAALEALLAIGDATFPAILEAAIRRLYRAGEER